jgi:hypothetical protein
MPDETDRKSIGEYGAWLVLTDKENHAFTNWDTPSEEVYIPSTEKIEKGKTLTALIVFSGCAADDKGNCNLLAKYKVLLPDGSVYADLPFQEAWIDKPVPAKRSLGLSIGYIQVVIEAEPKQSNAFSRQLITKTEPIGAKNGIPHRPRVTMISGCYEGMGFTFADITIGPNTPF